MDDQTRTEQPKPLTRLDVTHRRALEPGMVWLISHGFEVKHEGLRTFLVRDGKQ